MVDERLRSIGVGVIWKGLMRGLLTHTSGYVLRYFPEHWWVGLQR